MNKYLILLLMCALLTFSNCKKNTPHFTLSEPTYKSMKAVALADTLPAPTVIATTGTNAPKLITTITSKKVPLKHPYGVGKPTVTTYNAAQGLAGNIVTGLVTDHDGNLWIGGYGFLSKYDGTTFTNYSNANGAGSSIISSMLVDSQNNIWIESLDGLRTFNGRFFKHIKLDKNDEILNFRQLIEDSNGAIWVGSQKGVFRSQGDSVNNFRIHEEDKNNRVLAMAMGKNGKVLAETPVGISQFNGSEFIPFEQFNALNTKGAKLLFTDSKGIIWLQHWENNQSQLATYDGNNLVYLTELDGFLNNQYIQFGYEDRKGNLWFGTSKGLQRYDGERFYNMPIESIDYLTSMVEDDCGNLWIGSSLGLLNISYSYMNALEWPLDTEKSNSWMVNSKDELKTKWVSTANLLIRFDETHATIYDLGTFLDRGVVSNLYADTKGNIWLTANGNSNEPELIKFDGENFYSYPAFSDFKIEAYNISEDKQGNLVLIGNGPIIYFDGKSFTKFDDLQDHPINPTAFYEDSKGRKLIGSYNDGVFVYSSDSLLHISKENGLPSKAILDIEEYPIGNIWIATFAGLSKFDGTTLTNYGEADGLPNIVTNLKYDTVRDQLWIASGNSLSSLSYDNNNTALKPKITTYSQQNGFDVVTGSLPYNHTLFDNYGVWGNSFQGIYRIDADKIVQFEAPKLALKNVRVNNQNVLWSLLLEKQKPDSLLLLNESVLKFSKPITNEKAQEMFANFGNIQLDGLSDGALIPTNLQLPYTNNSITLEFVAISPSFGKYTQYRYKLDGYDKHWSPLSTKNEAYFGNMNEGQYTFYLEAVSAYGSTSHLTYSFKVLPPWWRTWWAYLIYGLLVLLIARRLHLHLKARTLRKERERLQQKELEQAKEIEKAYSELKSTQAQLIQSEKMASLGELTAGIAHEIQNPLNFVNNFSEVSVEMMQEVRQEIDTVRAYRDKPIPEDALNEMSTILDDIESNLGKITHHGKRADAIVKGMLAHSRSSSGEKVPTEINALVDEYLRLSYHGMRAKDKTFNADYKTYFDADLPKVNVVSQDIGRVLLNLINNAFQAVASVDAPLVVIYTKVVSEGIEITVKDNGTGIPNAIKDKIFQPFFTTKPTGQGTGLGLSLSYDIVKAHGGEIQVVSKEGEGTSFIIKLPG